MYLFIRLAHFGLQVISLLIDFVNDGMQLFAGFLFKEMGMIIIYWKWGDNVILIINIKEI